MDAQGAENQIRTGHKLLIVSLVLMLIVVLITAIMDSLVFRIDTVFWGTHLFRMSMTGVLCFFVYTGRVWAHWLIAILLGFAGGVDLLGSLLNAISILESTLLETFAVFITGILKLGAMVLMFLPDARRFLAYQKSRRIQQWGEDMYKGREKVIGVITLVLFVSLFTIVFYNIMVGPDKLLQQGIRFVLTAVLCALMYEGHKWARLLFGVLSFFAIILGIVQGIALLLQGNPGGVLLLLFAIPYTISIGIIFLSPRVALFFEYQQGLHKSTQQGTHHEHNHAD